ncbi:hypothetical protein [Pseudoalteromonas denitrificans]|uniref:DUF3352 domain-containing protein n=1 Tax=Pseudoalteromonas denitrificans DSM 6059 TaxID=1123010 RepID=A0A1I1M9D1_9GAMM|nr:hypothetical protein [Pseudoalteromonas denitrificans]SFC81974.1 hypothetical protein SAMN02745724_02620 [Pseudoalteromonas denitrificans DSM 6059]
MKKVLIAVAAIAAAGTAYLYNKQDSSVSNVQSLESPALSYVPAETLFFSGQLKPFPLKKYITLFSKNEANHQQLDSIVTELSTGEHSGQKFLVSLLETYRDTINSPDLLMQNYGVEDSFSSLFYTVGLLPVMRYEISKPEALWAMLDKAQKASGIKVKVNTSSGIEYKSYTLYEEDNQVIELTAAVNNGWATVTFNTPVNDQKQLELALAINKPESSLENTHLLNKMVTKYGFDSAYLGFFNHVALVNGLTNKDNNQFSQMFNKMLTLANTKTDTNTLDVFRDKACQDDLSTIVNNWPRTVFGTKAFNVSQSSLNLKASMIIESENTELMQVLSGLRGFLPEHLHSAKDKIMSFGLGLDVAKVTPVLTTLWNDFTQTKYQCTPLVEMQAEVAKNSPMMTAMVTGMATDVKGLSVSLFDFELSTENNKPELKTLDALMTFSVKNPISFFNSIKAFYPPFSNLKLEADGTSVALNEYLPILTEFGVNLELAVKGDNIVLLSGNKALEVSQSLIKQSLVNNGVNSFSLDYKKFFTPLFDVAAMAGQELPSELESLKNTDMRIHFLMDYTNNGIEFNSTMDSEVN